MSEYGFLATSYDGFTTDVHYPEWADYIQTHFQRTQIPGDIVLDLACGTGSLTYLLAQRGYEMIGVDSSVDMLTQAMEKQGDFTGETPPIFLCQPMEELDLYGTIDACICCLDSVNHVVDPQQLQAAFARVHLFMAPGGLFLFDINSPEKLQGLDGGIFLDETEDAYCVWRADYEAERRICTFGLDIFQRHGANWQRGGEWHEELAYTVDELTTMLTAVGFTDVSTYGALSFQPPQSGEQRIFFTARKD